ncbi:MAG: hypothetical protein M3P24_03055 [Gemmatimonadota bacterium]|nr:hypothetical protein [Gemmatimonadota bacterium]
MIALTRHFALAVLLTALAACGGQEDAPEAAPADAPATGAPAGGMEGMPGMQPGAAADPLDAHMQMMQGASGDQLKAMIPEHRQLVANMIAQYNREMREMNMSTDAEWNSTVDALRQDLVHLPEMSAEELKTFMPEHQSRINKLREMHKGMMGNMKM